MPPTKRNSCALCGAVERTHLIDKDGYPIARCRSCGLVQVDVELGRDELEGIYGEDFFTEEELFHDYVAQRGIRVESGAKLAEVLVGLVPGGKLLDVGSAAGFFLEAASRHYDVTGVEFSPFAAEYARGEFGHRVLTGDVTEVGLEGEQFDVVTMWATIEHMADPLAAVRAVASLTRPGGLFVLSTGDVTGPLARRDLHGWNLMLPPYHLFFFSPQTIDAAAQEGRLPAAPDPLRRRRGHQRAARHHAGPELRDAARPRQRHDRLRVASLRAAAAAIPAASHRCALPAAAAGVPRRSVQLARLPHDGQLVGPQRPGRGRRVARKPQPREESAEVRIDPDGPVRRLGRPGTTPSARRSRPAPPGSPPGAWRRSAPRRRNARIGQRGGRMSYEMTAPPGVSTRHISAAIARRTS